MKSKILVELLQRDGPQFDLQKPNKKQRFHGNRNHVPREGEERSGKEQLVRSLRKGGYRACVKLLELSEK